MLYLLFFTSGGNAIFPMTRQTNYAISWINSVRCNGTEDTLLNCSHSFYEHQSGARSEDAWVSC